MTSDQHFSTASTTIMMRVINPSAAQHTHTFVNLHGRDSNAAEYSSEFMESRSSSDQSLQSVFPTIKWVFPSAPRIPSQRFGLEMSQWFDMWSTENPLEHWGTSESLQLRGSAEVIAQLALHEGRLVGGLDKVVLGGISQGAATAILTMAMLLATNERVCAFVCFSTWSPPTDVAIEILLDACQKSAIPVFLAHCGDDEVIDVRYGEALVARLKKSTCLKVESHQYPDGGHWINESQGIEDLIEFIRGAIGK